MFWSVATNKMIFFKNFTSHVTYQAHIYLHVISLFGSNLSLCNDIINKVKKKLSNTYLGYAVSRHEPNREQSSLAIHEMHPEAAASGWNEDGA